MMRFVALSVLAILSWPALVSSAAESAEAKTDAQDESLDKLLKESDTARWTMLPKWIYRVRLDAKGRPWFEARSFDIQGNASAARSVERAAAGKTKVIRAEIYQVDRAGRFFIPERFALRCFDPKSKRWIRQNADGTEVSDD